MAYLPPNYGTDTMIQQAKPESDLASSLRIDGGLCHIMFAYDAARSIDLDAAERRTHAISERQTLRNKRRAPSYLEYRPPPLRVSFDGRPLPIGEFTTRPNVDLLLYDFGAIAVHYSIALDNSFDALLPLSERLYDNAALLADSRKRIDELLKTIGDAATNPYVAPIVEDYIIFHIESLSPMFEAGRLRDVYGPQVARILRAENRPLSEQEVNDVMATTMSYGTDDIVVIDWNAALIVDREGEDVREVLQFANVELLEMRHLDQRLSRALDRTYETLSKTRGSWKRKLGRYATELRALAELQVDSATLFEGVNNALKLIGDQYLARSYRLVSRRFHLDDWDAGILRKLKTLESIYQTMSDQASTRRMEVLEWVIIALFVFSIALEIIALF
jgi:hypothetical protein